MDRLNKIEELLNIGNTDEAIALAQEFINSSSIEKDKAYYLMGNAYRKKSNWQMAINCYLEAMETNPESPAKQAHALAMNILNYYNKEMYNP